MKHIQSKAFAGHKGAKAVCAVSPAFGTADDCEARNPAIGDGKRRVDDRCGCIILSVINLYIGNCQNYCSKQQRNTMLLQFVCDFLMGKHIVSEQKTESVNAKTIYADHGGIQNLCRSPHRDPEKNQDRHIYFLTERIQTAFFYSSYEYKDQRQNPHHLNCPEHADAGYRHDQIEDKTRKCVRNMAEGIAECHIKISLSPSKYEDANRGRNQEFSRSCADKLFHTVGVQIVFCTHSADEKEDDHKPWIQ